MKNKSYIATLSGKAITLTSNTIEALEQGRLFVMSNYVVGIGVSRNLFLVSEPGNPQQVISEPLDKLVSSLLEQKAQVLRAKLLFPFSSVIVSPLKDAASLAAHSFLMQRWEEVLKPTLDMTLLPIFLPLPELTKPVVTAWSEILLLADALAAEHPLAMGEFREALWRVSKDWEAGWNVGVNALEDRLAYSSDGMADIVSVDRQWSLLVGRHLEPHGYVRSLGTTLRLL